MQNNTPARPKEFFFPLVLLFLPSKAGEELLGD